MTDAAGTHTYAYGLLGEITKETHTINRPENSTSTLTFTHTYDSWNRIQTLTYDDGETLTYNYALDGDLQSITSNTHGTHIQQQRNNKYQQLTQINYGNGVTTHYNYETRTPQRLSNLTTTTTKQVLQNNTYSYENSLFYHHLIYFGNNFLHINIPFWG